LTRLQHHRRPDRRKQAIAVPIGYRGDAIADRDKSQPQLPTGFLAENIEIRNIDAMRRCRPDRGRRHANGAPLSQGLE